jgi:hypothetical protein
MSRMMRVAAPVLFAACASESRPANQADDTAREEVIEAVESYYADFSARDWDRFSGHFWPSATLTTVWQKPGENAPRVVTTTVLEFVRLAPQGPDSKPIFEERMDSSDVRIAGNLAHVWAHYTARFGDSTDVATWHGIDAFTLMKHDGHWRIVALAYTDAP